ncbi:MAG TPA: DUF1015 domain-containing protein [Actinomycetota bacterium]|nr:DUF1015 domain-containing protein [Actinomycetota bacterium]
MPRIGPFSGLTYDVAAAGPLDRLTAPPYDVISEPYRDRYRSGSPYNIVHLDLAQAHPGSTREQAADPYEAAGERLRAWIAEGIFVRSPEPMYFAYEMRFSLGGRRRRIRGLLCAMDLEPWGGDVVPHEQTMPGPVEDRLRLLRATGTHLSPIYGIISGPNEPLARLLDEVAGTPPPFAILDEEGVEHRMWPVAGTVDVPTWLAEERLLIADGHHRYTTALRFRLDLDADTGPGPWDQILTLVVDAGVQDVPVLPYHRLLVAGTAASDGPRDEEAAPDLMSVLASVDDDTLRYGMATRSEDGRLRFALHRLTGEPPTVAALHHQVLDRIAPEDAIRFTHDAEDAAAAIRSGAAVAAYLLPPTSPDRIRAVVERGERLPRKSTFFWPKPRTGMVLMSVGRPALTRPPRVPPAS